MKKLISTLLIITCIFSSLLMLTGSAAVQLPFADVKQGDWFYADVCYVYENGLFNGVGETRFAPNAACTRGMLVTVLYRIEKTPETTATCPFSDVKKGSYYEKAITWAAANEIVNGVGDARFAPDERLTREQTATILYRYASYCKMDVTASVGLTGYTDEYRISNYAKRALSWANAEKLILGTTQTTLSPKGNTTRAQMAAILHRFCLLRDKQDEARHTYSIPSDSFFSQAGGWMVNNSSDYVWAGEDENAEKYGATAENGAISIVSDGTHDVNLLYMTFAPENTGIALDGGALRLRVYVSDTAWLQDTWCVLEIGSGENGWMGKDSLRWQLNGNVLSQKGWNEITLKFGDAEKTTGSFKPEEFKFLWLAATKVPAGVTLRMDNIRLEGTALTPAPVCTHEKCEVCGGCLAESCDCTIEGCCTPCVCSDILGTEPEDPPDEDWSPWF